MSADFLENIEPLLVVVFLTGCAIFFVLFWACKGGIQDRLDQKGREEQDQENDHSQ